MTSLELDTLGIRRESHCTRLAAQPDIFPGSSGPCAVLGLWPAHEASFNSRASLSSIHAEAALLFVPWPLPSLAALGLGYGLVLIG